MSFRDNLQYLRSTRAMTQEQLASALGVSRQSVTKWESERAYPEMDKLLLMCDLFDCTLDDLVRGDVTKGGADNDADGDAADQLQSKNAALPSTDDEPTVRATANENAADSPVEPAGPNTPYDRHMRAFSWKIALGVFCIIFGGSLFTLMVGFAQATNPHPEIGGSSNAEALGLVPLFFGVAVGIGLLITAGFQHSDFLRKHPQLKNCYTEEDRQSAQRAFVVQLIAGFLVIFAGIIAFMVSASYEAAAGLEEGTLTSAFITAAAAIAALLIIRGSLMLSRLNIANYNEARQEAIAESDEGRFLAYEDMAAVRSMYTDQQICELLGIANASDEEIARARARIERKHRKSQITSGLCAIIMIIATIVALVKLFQPAYRDPLFWMAWPIGGLLCGVVAIAVNAFIKDQPSA